MPPVSTAPFANATGRTSGGWVRAVGYHESISGPLDRHRLDALVGDRPARVQHAVGVMWILSSAALDRTGLGDLGHVGVERAEDGSPTGRCYGLDALKARAACRRRRSTSPASAVTSPAAGSPA